MTWTKETTILFSWPISIPILMRMTEQRKRRDQLSQGTPLSERIKCGMKSSYHSNTIPLIFMIVSSMHLVAE